MTRKLSCCLGLGTMLFAGAAGAVSFNIAPIRADLAGNKSASIEIKNPSDQPLDLEVEAVSWTQDAQGKDIHAPSNDLRIYPSRITVEPGGSRTIRIATTDNAARPDQERAYRVYVTELPPPRTTNAASAEHVTVRLRVGVPVFVHKPNAVPKLAGTVVDSGAGSLDLKITNTGSAHARLTSITSNPSGLSDNKLDEWYVLAGSSQVYHLPIPAALCKQGNVTLQINTDSGKPVPVPVNIPAKACPMG